MKQKSNGSNTALLSVNDRRLTGILCNFESLLQKHFHDTVEVQTVMFFLQVASKEEAIDLSEIGKNLNLSKSALSRNYYRLADGKTGDDGLGLVKALVDYSDRRRMPVVLTEKGIEVARELVAYMNKAFTRYQELNLSDVT